MAKNISVTIQDLCDGFNVVIIKDGEEDECYHFDQEDTREGLVDMFASIGIHAEYEEVY